LALFFIIPPLLLSYRDSPVVIVKLVDEAGDDDSLEDAGAKEEGGAGQLLLVQVEVGVGATVVIVAVVI
jgi:hypothetical protein